MLRGVKARQNEVCVSCVRNQGLREKEEAIQAAQPETPWILNLLFIWILFTTAKTFTTLHSEVRNPARGHYPYFHNPRLGEGNSWVEYGVPTKRSQSQSEAFSLQMKIKEHFFWFREIQTDLKSYFENGQHSVKEQY